MLVLTRAIGERLIIGEKQVYLSILEVRGNQVRIGIEAPRDIKIHREEVLIRRQEAQEKIDAINESTVE